MKIAILGGTSHIAKSLIDNYLRQGKDELSLFVRSRERMEKFLTEIGRSGKAAAKSFDELDGDKYDLLINCVGIRLSGDVENHISSIFELTEKYDDLAINYLIDHPAALYLNFSSGAVFGSAFDRPVDESSQARWDANNIKETDYYGIAKLHSEAKHRSLKALNIIDIRNFGYFSRFIDLELKYFMSELISCVKNKQEFITDKQNMVRDYIHPDDLFLLVNKCVEKGKLNDVFDAYSLKPAAKFEIIEYFVGRYGLRYKVKENVNISSITGQKNQYYSTSKKAQKIGYRPHYTTMEAIAQEAELILQKK